MSAGLDEADAIGYFGHRLQHAVDDQGVDFDATEAPPPALADLVTNDLDRAALKIVTSVKYAVYPMAMPPSTSDAIVEAYRAAFSKLMADPQFLADASKLIPDIVPHTGIEVETLAKEIPGSDKAVLDRTRQLFQ